MRPVESFTPCFEETTMPVCPWQYYKRAREVFAHNIDWKNLKPFSLSVYCSIP